MARAVRLLTATRRPLMFVGRGAVHAADGLRRLAERLEIPTVAEGRAKGVLEDRDLLSVGLWGAAQLWDSSDLVILVGSRARHSVGVWPRRPGQQVLQIDIDPAHLHDPAPGDVGMVADSALAVAGLLEAVGRTGPRRSARREELRGLRDARMKTFETRLPDQMRHLRAIRAVLPDDAIIVPDYTQVGYVACAAFPAFRPGTLITPGYQGTLGFAFATALGAKVGCPDRPVISLNGDGGFLFTLPELATAVKHRIGAISIVFSDGAYGNVRRLQKTVNGGRVIATDLQNPDFVALAQSFGAHGVRARDELEVGLAVREAMRRDLPTVIDVPVGEMNDPWPLLRPQLPEKAGG
ncbi:thiamine pyrophosphate-dependent enzyme [Salipiger mucosus]|uniref:Acetohydroxy acid synthase n=1 Tax=Salipiger mucosus DSM 16094 TaxID=1123237 RepID=S9S2D0_9RHOB|nr:thiamine pyrophosphate-dependent enzyme [Salipiger mucosus]EPX80364.1 Acetohydroxy acid synthase [Salipiger mucosus DSM 16094]